MQSKINILLFLVFLYSFFFKPKSIHAQAQGKVYEMFNDATVNAYGNNLNSPWCGGINSVQINHADLNNDSKKDLILFDQNNNTLKTFLNVGTNGEIKYAYSPMYQKNFPTIESFLALRDYNCDGIPDLFFNGPFGMPCYKGYYQNNELKFTFYKNIWARRVSQNDSINVYVQNNDIPSIEDVDGDGDLDITAFDVQGVYTVLHKNMRVEWGLPCDSMKMIISDKCWGKFFQNYNREVIMNSFCVQSPVNKKNRHTGNCILQLDIEGDGDMDLMGGNISFSDAQLLFNNGSDVMNGQDTNYNLLGHKLYMPSWPSPFHVDIDNDGDKDLLFTSHNDDFSSANYNAVAYYKNIGNSTTPNYIWAHDSLLTPDMIDIGSNSYPTFFDFDKDGKKDLFIGSEGYLDNTLGLLKSKLAYYKNTSTLGNVSFQLLTNDFLNLSSKNIRGIFPTFGDVTGDGIDDLVYGCAKGDIAVYKNTAANNTSIPNFQFVTDSVDNLNFSKYSMPVVYDFNADGKNDIIIGNQAGRLEYFEDTSSNATPHFALKTISLGNVKTGSNNTFYGYSAPFIGKIDNTDSTFLLIGNADGNIEKYDSVQNNYLSFNKRDSLYSLINVTNRAVPAVADLDGDGKYEMVIGNKMGGLFYYKQVLDIFPVNIADIPFNANSLEIYPNPTTDQLQLLFKDNFINKLAKVSLFDMMGRKISNYSFQSQTNSSIHLGTIANGIYFLEIEINNQKVTKKIIKN